MSSFHLRTTFKNLRPALRSASLYYRIPVTLSHSARTALPSKRTTAPLQLRAFVSSARKMSTGNEEKIRNGTMDPALPGEEYEVRQVANSDDYTPDPSKSLKLEPPQQRLVDDVLELYSCRPTVERVKRYTPDCVYDDQFVYANDRYKMAGQWFGLPMGFDDSKNERYQVVVNQPGLIQFKNEQVTFSLPPILQIASS